MPLHPPENPLGQSAGVEKGHVQDTSGSHTAWDHVVFLLSPQVLPNPSLTSRFSSNFNQCFITQHTL